jgi:predicted amidohydrolase
VHTAPFFAFVESLAQEAGVAILAGSAPYIEDECLYNTAILALGDGRTWLQHKLFPTPEEREWGMVGGTAISVIDAPWGRTCVLVCYDSEFPSISAALASAEPELFLIPSMTNADGLYRVRWAAKARVVEHHAYAVIASIVASDIYGELYCGQVSALTPRQPGFPGVLALGPLDESALVAVDLDLEKLRQSRKSAGMYPARDQERWPKEIELK